jgi:hypothetical protein
MADAGGFQLGDRAFQQRILDIVIEPRLDDQRARAGDVGRASAIGIPSTIDRLVQVLGAATAKAKGCFYFISDNRAA